jgi:hypothetical protein
MPGVAAAWAAPPFAPGGALALHAALWAWLGGDAGSDAAAAAALAAAAPAAAERLPALLDALRLLEDLRRAARGRREAVGPAARAALSGIAAALRAATYVAEDAGGAAAAAARGSGSDSDSDGGGAEAAKLARSAEEQGAALAARRARRLLPECLRLAKALSAAGGAAKAD